jgi:gamma-glutamylcyclotransferase (GGCT)/AIG2-like uncharacterized protein YtfP
MSGGTRLAAERPPSDERTVVQAVVELNRLRRSLDATARASADRLAEILFGTSRRLIAYGSLAPGGSNAAQLDGLPGTWQGGWVTGTLAEAGWGAAIGYPALRWLADAGQRVPAHLFTSPDLPEHWARLDEFEGDAYRRIFAPIFDHDGLLAVGYLYESAASAPAGD